MARTIQCTHCGIVLKLPDHAVGKRLKCPHCGNRFGSNLGDERSLESSVMLRDADPAQAPGGSGDRPGSSAEALPTVEGDVREIVEVPLLDEVAAAPKASRGGVSPPGGGSKPVADAQALFNEPTKKPRRLSAAEARAQARRCPTCGGVVPAGMSLCATCGLDLETGVRTALDDNFAPPPEFRRTSTPLSIAIIGGIALLASAVFAVLTASLWVRGYEGFQYFVPIALFGVFAAVQFLRLKSMKLLIMALSFGVAIDIVALVAMPIYRANAETEAVARAPEDPDKADMAIPSVVEKLDTDKLTLGLVIVLGYAGLSAYLLSPSVNRHFH
jgi:hypothetical protein